MFCEFFCFLFKYCIKHNSKSILSQACIRHVIKADMFGERRGEKEALNMHIIIKWINTCARFFESKSSMLQSRISC